MADFSQAQAFVKVAEGGYTDDPRDNGNWTGGRINQGTLIGTNHGISAPVLSDWLGRTATVSDMKNLSYQTALQIYKKNYWDALSLSSLINHSVALLIYDGAVNQGVGRMKQLIADSLTQMGKPATSNEKASSLVAKINTVKQQQFYDILKEKRRQSYNPNSPFYAGWMNRINKLGFFLTENIKRQVRQRPEMTLFVSLLIITAITGLIVYKKTIVSTINK
jgi:lysozyme family protein